MGSVSNISLRVSVPVCNFRKGLAREYLETEAVPPPSTIYGFLLSMVGKEDRNEYLGTQIAYALLSRPELSTTLRTIWRIKSKKTAPGIGNNRRPDYQEILTGLDLLIWVSAGALAERIDVQQKDFSKIERGGGLSLGESRDLVNDILYSPELGERKGLWVKRDEEGDLTLPIWVDHVGSKDTIWRQFSLEEGALRAPASDDVRWIAITNERE